MRRQGLQQPGMPTLLETLQFKGLAQSRIRLQGGGGMIAITSMYVRYLLPMMVEVQWWDHKWERGES